MVPAGLRVLLIACALVIWLFTSPGSSAQQISIPWLYTANYQGMWYAAPAESEAGWGINFAHQDDAIFATWFTHDINGQAWFLSMSAFRTGATNFNGTLVRTVGPPFSTVPFNPAQVQVFAVGSAGLFFADANNGTITYTVDGISQSKSITRQLFGVAPTCKWNRPLSLAAATNYQDMWWSLGGMESGWGINFAHQGDVIFATWFTYDVAGNPLPMSATLFKVGPNPNTFAGTVIKTTGPPFSAVPWNPAAVVRTELGTATVTFANGNRATFSYTVALNGPMSAVTQSKEIERQVFRPPGTICQPPTPLNAPDRFLTPPFAGDLPLVSWFDHDRGIGTTINFRGEVVSTEDNHPGHDWEMPAGTPVLAAADGIVYFVSDGFCEVPDKSVQIFHDRPNGQVVGYTTNYGHLSDVVVTRDQKVTAGQVIGHSAPGDRPSCHVFKPHLHFGVFRQTMNQFTLIDPYGWVGSPAIPDDPWATQPDGGPSAYLWQVAPLLFQN